MGFNVYSDEIRAALDKLGWSQREAAWYLEIPERDFLGFCAGKPCARAVLLALHWYIEHPPPESENEQ